KWTRGTKNDDVIDARGAKAPKIAGAGIGVVILVYVVARLFNVDISGLVGGGGNSSTTTSSSQKHEPEPPKGPDPDAELVDFVRFVMKDIQDTFERVFQAEGKTYERAKLVLFTDAIDTKCGRSSSAIGPFYCPGDSNAYIDLSFYRDLRSKLGAPGDFAQAYVLAHEIGHHLQNLLGVDHDQTKLSKSRTRNEHSVRVELQADCYAGVWAHHAAGKKLLEIGDLEEAMTAAKEIGDDRLQKKAGVDDINPETFTHGTSEQRMRWFRIGFDRGTLAACDTFSAQP
ncbi:MAG: neutral zinc metallopeptidase, partial [Kofleriaceae bacterium]